LVLERHALAREILPLRQHSGLRLVVAEFTLSTRRAQDDTKSSRISPLPLTLLTGRQAASFLNTKGQRLPLPKEVRNPRWVPHTIKFSLFLPCSLLVQIFRQRRRQQSADRAASRQARVIRLYRYLALAGELEKLGRVHALQPELDKLDRADSFL
jgi:hypothetical protein